MSAFPIATRRQFLTRGLGLVGVGSVLPNFLVNTCLADPTAGPDQRILVVIQLNGGHDGMSDVPPYGEPKYAEYRQQTRIGDKEVIKLNPQYGLHPNLKGCKELLDQGRFAVIVGTGYPNFDYSHFEAMDIWETGDEKNRRKCGAGWIGRYLDVALKGNPDPKLAIAVGFHKTPVLLWAREHPGLAFGHPDAFRFSGVGDEKGLTLYRKLNQLAAKDARGELQFVTHTAVSANAASDQVRQVASGYKTPIEYPNTGLAGSLRTIAGLIGGGLSTRVYYTAIGGFDTHSSQRPQHDSLMAQIDGAVSAFWKDMDRQGNARRVMMMTFSEFGRTVRENASQGTDHGSAQPMFLMGPGVKPGCHGKYPSLTDLRPDGQLKMEVDFRSVYAAILDRWLATPHEGVLGARYAPLDCVKA
jgi:uncharacterized protein (DUF1501 family)